MAGSAQQKPAELEAAQPDSWTHVNHDPPVSHRHALKISRFRQSLEQFETGVFIQAGAIKLCLVNWYLVRYLSGSLADLPPGQLHCAGFREGDQLGTAGLPEWLR